VGRVTHIVLVFDVLWPLELRQLRLAAELHSRRPGAYPRPVFIPATFEKKCLSVHTDAVKASRLAQPVHLRLGPVDRTAGLGREAVLSWARSSGWSASSTSSRKSLNGLEAMLSDRNFCNFLIFPSMPIVGRSPPTVPDHADPPIWRKRRHDGRCWVTYL